MREHARRLRHIVGIDLASSRDVLERERLYRRAKIVELIDPLVTEFAIVKFLGEDHIEQAGEKCWVLSRLDRQPDIGRRRKFGATGIDDDQLHPPRFRSTQRDEWVCPLQSTGWRIRRHQRVVPNGHHHIGVAEVMPPRFPLPHPQTRGQMCRLIDGHRCVKRW